MSDWYIPQRTIDGLNGLKDIEDDACAAFCKTAQEFILKGFNTRAYSTAASKLNLSVETVKDALEALVYVLNEAVRTKTTLDAFPEMLEKYCGTLKPAVTSGLAESLNEVGPHLRSHFAELNSTPYPSYKDLEWRLDVTTATRSCHDLCEPMLTLKLKTEENGVEQSRLLEMDPRTVIQVTSELEKACAELKTREYRKIRNYLQ